MNKEVSSKIIDDAREKIAKTPIETHKYRGKRYITLDGIDQLLALSGTADIECPECGGNSLEEMATASNWVKFSPCHKCNGTGVIKYPWKFSVVLEKGELPIDDLHGTCMAEINALNILIANGKYRQVVE